MAYLKHLLLILLVYNPIKALAKLAMLKYLQKGIRPSILAEMQNNNLKLKSFI